ASPINISSRDRSACVTSSLKASNAIGPRRDQLVYRPSDRQADRGRKRIAICRSVMEATSPHHWIWRFRFNYSRVQVTSLTVYLAFEILRPPKRRALSPVGSARQAGSAEHERRVV